VLTPLREAADEILEPPIRAALAAAGDGATALDLACNEGWYAQRLLAWGARRVLGVDTRELNTRRALLLRDHFGIEPARLDVRRSDLFELDPEELGEFDVVAMLGILYHLENPVGAMRLARALTRGVCVIESQVISSDEPIEVRYADGSVLSEPAGFAVHRESDAETALSPLAAMPGVISLIPNRAAIVALALAAGFRSAEVLPEPLDDRGEPRRGDRAVVIARS